MKLSLSMIVRNAEGSLRACLDSALPAVDELVIVDTGSTDDTKAVAIKAAEDHDVPLVWEDYKDPLGHEKWISDFSIPRQRSFDLATGDMILWLDADDVLMEFVDGQQRIGCSELRLALEANCSEMVPVENRIDAVNMRYDYRMAEDGKPSFIQQRLRVVRKGFFQWGDGTMPLHEALVPTRPSTRSDNPYDADYWVRHTGAHDPESSATRNLWIVEQWEGAGKPMTPRLWKGKADALRLLGREDEAVEAFTLGLADAHSPEDRYHLFLRRGDALRQAGDPAGALDDFARATRERPRYSQGYLSQAEVLAEQGMWDQVLALCAVAENLGTEDKESIGFNPVAAAALPTYLRARAYMAMEQYEKALPQWEALGQIWQGNPEVEMHIGGLRKALHERRVFDAFMEVHSAIADDPEAQAALRKAAPPMLRNHPVIARDFRPPRPEGKPVVVIYCGQTINLWGPKSLDEGTGGSEESAIYMSRQLVKRGYHVEVYGSPRLSEIGEDEHGVVWLPFHAWKYDDKADVFISWRSPQALSNGRFCDQRYIWLQDIPQHQWYTPELCEDLDGILCISEFQSRFTGENAQGKVILTGNGIDPDQMADGPNHHHKFIYASSPDRGLKELLTVWPRIKEAIPEAELHVFYGFRDVYLKGAQQNDSLLKEKEAIEALIEQPGVINHGMVGQPELHKWFAECGFWLYPTSFEEAYCVTADKAMACGAIPVTSRNPESSLPEVCGPWDEGPEPRDGKIKNDREWLEAWADRVIEIAGCDLSGRRSAMKEWCREEHDWNHRGAQWADLFAKEPAHA